MTPNSHPSDELIASYATGNLPLAPGLVIAAHLDSCNQCRLRVRRIEDAEGRLMCEMSSAPMSDGALARALAHIEGDALDEPLAPHATNVADVPIPPSVSRLGLGPRRYLSPDFWIAPVRTPSRDNWRTYILRAPAGARIPAHTHHGPEYVHVILGGFKDGRPYAAGDFADSPPGGAHRLRIDAAGPCACLIASEGRSRWRGIAAAVAPLFGV